MSERADRRQAEDFEEFFGHIEPERELQGPGGRVAALVLMATIVVVGTFLGLLFS